MLRRIRVQLLFGLFYALPVASDLIREIPGQEAIYISVDNGGPTVLADLGKGSEEKSIGSGPVTRIQDSTFELFGGGPENSKKWYCTTSKSPKNCTVPCLDG